MSAISPSIIENLRRCRRARALWVPERRPQRVEHGSYGRHGGLRVWLGRVTRVAGGALRARYPRSSFSADSYERLSILLDGARRALSAGSTDACTARTHARSLPSATLRRVVVGVAGVLSEVFCVCAKVASLALAPSPFSCELQEAARWPLVGGGSATEGVAATVSVQEAHQPVERARIPVHSHGKSMLAIGWRAEFVSMLHYGH